MILSHTFSKLIQPIKEAGFYRRERLRKNLGDFGKAIVAVDAETDNLGLSVRNLGQQADDTLVIGLVPRLSTIFGYVHLQVQGNGFETIGI